MTKIYILFLNNIPFYIGKTTTLNQRKSYHKKTYGSNIHLEIIDEVEDWKFWEKHYISLYKSWGFELLNKNNGGGGPTNWTEEQKLNINPDRINKIKNHKTRGEKISKTLNKTIHSNYYNEEVRIKISKSKNSKSIIQYDLEMNFIKEWDTIGLAATYLGNLFNKITSKRINTQIRDTCIGRQKTCYGFKWKYKDE